LDKPAIPVESAVLEQAVVFWIVFGESAIISGESTIVGDESIVVGESAVILGESVSVGKSVLDELFTNCLDGDGLFRSACFEVNFNSEGVTYM